jgi:hypothetical protein
MARPLAKSPFVLLALGLWILACPASQSDDDEFKSLNQQVHKLFEQGKYQEAIPLAENAVELAKRVYGPQRTYLHGEQPQQSGSAVQIYGRVRQSRTAPSGSTPHPAEGSWARKSRHRLEPK